MTQCRSVGNGDIRLPIITTHVQNIDKTTVSDVEAILSLSVDIATQRFVDNIISKELLAEEDRMCHLIVISVAQNIHGRKEL